MIKKATKQQECLIKLLDIDYFWRDELKDKSGLPESIKHVEKTWGAFQFIYTLRRNKHLKDCWVILYYPMPLDLTKEERVLYRISHTVEK